MADWPLSFKASKVVVGDTQLDSANSKVLNINTGTIHTKTAWVEQFSSTPYDANGIIVRPLAYLDDEFLIDIAVGSSGNETIIANNLYGGNSYGLAAERQAYDYFFPIYIPQGSRLSMRIQANHDTAYLGTQIMLLVAGESGSSCSQIYTYGADTTDTGGVEVDPGGTANTKGGWVEIVSSTSEMWEGFIIALGNKGNTGRSSMYGLLDIGVGAASSEQALVPNFAYASHTDIDRVCPMVSPFLPIRIPAGTRISVRSQCDITEATDRLFDVILYGVG